MTTSSHFIVVYDGTDPTDAQTISQSFTAGTNAVFNSTVAAVTDTETASFNISYSKPATSYKVHYVVLDASSATAAYSASFTAQTGPVMLTPTLNRRKDSKVRM